MLKRRQGSRLVDTPPAAALVSPLQRNKPSKVARAKRRSRVRHEHANFPSLIFETQTGRPNRALAALFIVSKKAMPMITITLPDGSKKPFDPPVTVAEVAASIGAGLAKATVAGALDGKLVDASD